jgi:large conductance mechanosensitive channel
VGDRRPARRAGRRRPGGVRNGFAARDTFTDLIATEGGVGKTALACATAVRLADHGKRDPQTAGYDHILFDTAPTGQTLRLLSLPRAWTTFLESGTSVALLSGRGNQMLKGFKEFLLRGNVVELAVAVVIGAAFGAVVTALVTDLLTPLIAAIGGMPDFSALTFTVNHSTFRYGHFVNVVVSFVLIAAAVYLVVVLPLGRVAERRKQRAAEATAKPEEVQLLAQIRDLLERGVPLPHGST